MPASLISGIFFILPCIENYSKVDLRTSVIDIPPQEVSQLVSYWQQAQPLNIFKTVLAIVRVGDTA